MMTLEGESGEMAGSMLAGGDMGFTALTDEERRELWRLSRFYWKEALRCEEAKAYLAGCVMLGSALETLLILMIDCYDEEAESTGEAPKQRGRVKPLLDWKLAELLRVAKAAKWLPAGLDLDDAWDHRKARIGDYAEVVRMVRNLAHPTRYQADHHGKRVTAKYLKQQFEIVLLCRDWLADRNNKALLTHMNERNESSETDSEMERA
jgi:hypothetical protein